MSQRSTPCDPDVSVVIPTRNNLVELQRCIASLQAQECRPSRVFVCVDGSTDQTLSWLSAVEDALAQPVVALSHPGNAHRGRAATRNLALSSLGSGFVWLLDSDMQATPDALTKHLAVASGRVAGSVGTVVYSNGDRALWAGYLNTRGRNRIPDGAVLPFTQFTTANSLVRADYFQELEGFDESFSTYGGEDLEFAWRLLNHTGLDFINNRRAIAVTVEEKTLEQALNQLESYGAINVHMMEGLHPDMPRTFELERSASRSPADRLFVASMNPVTDAVADVAVRVGPKRVRYLALNYMVVRTLWRGYLSGSARP